MIRSSLIAAAGMAVLGFCEVAHGQSSINRFDEIAGSWTGHASSHRVTLEIDTSGRFTARSPLGSETGDAKLQGGALVVPLVEHKGTLHLVRDGESLKGPGVLRGKTWEVSLVRTKRIVGKQ